MSEKFYLACDEGYGYHEGSLTLIKLKNNQPETLEKALKEYVEEQGFYADDYGTDGEPWPKVRFLTVTEDKKVSLKPAILAEKAKLDAEDAKYAAEQAASLEKRELAEYKRLHAIYGKKGE